MDIVKLCGDLVKVAKDEAFDKAFRDELRIELLSIKDEIDRIILLMES